MNSLHLSFNHHFKSIGQCPNQISRCNRILSVFFFREITSKPVKVYGVFGRIQRSNALSQQSAKDSAQHITGAIR